MTLRYMLFNKTNIVFALFLLLGFALPSAPKSYSGYAYGFAAILQAVFVAKMIFQKDKYKARIAGDIIFFSLVVLLLWELAVTKFQVLDRFLYPPPGEVFRLFIFDFPNLMTAFASSISILGAGYLIGTTLGVAFGLAAGWNKRLYDVAKPVTKVLAAIPPTIFLPYSIAILPTFPASSAFIIAMGVFWPAFTSALNGVFNIDRKLIDSARALNVTRVNMFLHVILPGTMPAILSGATIAIGLSFILLTAAELVGATNGMGWYVRYASDYATYPKVVVGILFMGIVVWCFRFFFEKLEKRLLRWR